MKILVLGATGATGRHIVDQALAAGFQVRVLVRSPEKLHAADTALDVVVGSATDAKAVAQAMAGVDAVVSALGSSSAGVITEATRAIVHGSAVTGVRRLVILSSLTVVSDRLTGPARLVGRMMKTIMDDKAEAEKLLRASDLDWTIVHAVRLTNGPLTATGARITKAPKVGLGESVSRADVAHYLLRSVSDDSLAHQAVAIAA